MAATADAPDDAVDSSSLFYDTWLDWLLVALLAVEGLVGAWIGVTLGTSLDRALAAEFAAEFFSDPDAAEFPLTEPELADAVYTIGTWVGWGLVLAGLATIAVAVWFKRYRDGVRERLDAGQQAPRWHAPLLGGLLATAFAFVPFPQVFGGAVAGYLSDRSATVDGALSGVVFGAPAYILWAAAILAALVAGLGVVSVFLVVVLLIQLVVDVAFAAIGGLAAGLLS